jgi:hypothetical protein
MYRTLSWLSPVVALVLAGPVLGAPQEKPLTKEQTDKLIANGEFKGTLSKIDNKTKNFTVQVEYYDVDQNKLRSLQQYIQRRTIEINRIRNLQQKQLQTIAFKAEVDKRTAEVYKKATRDVALLADEGMKVRLDKSVLPPKRDDNGKVVKYTAKELSARKGTGADKKLPGYTGE